MTKVLELQKLETGSEGETRLGSWISNSCGQ
ncbi:MAG: class III lanthipeptide [Elusimicrobiales bacterium]